MEGLCGTAAPCAPNPPAGGTGSPNQEAVGAYEALVGDGGPHWCGPTNWGDVVTYPRVGRCLQSACGG